MIRTEFSSIAYETAGCQTVSLGVTQALKGETADLFTPEWTRLFTSQNTTAETAL